MHPDLLIATRSLWHHRRVNLAIALGVAAATAVLTGALIVGDSMRGSLRELTLDRLGRVDALLVAQGFFREALADEITNNDVFQQHFSDATPVILFPNGTAQRSQSESTKNLGGVNVLGIHADFWQFGDSELAGIPELADDEVIINEVVADDLGINTGQLQSGDVRLTVGIPKQKLLPSDSSLGSKDDLVDRIVDLRVVKIISARSLGRFGLHPTQVPPRNVYLPIGAVQDALTDGLLQYKQSREQANMILLAGKSARSAVTPEQTAALTASLQPTLEDLGLNVIRVTQEFDGDTVFDYFSLSSDRLVIPDEAVASVRRVFPEAIELFTYLANDIAPLDSDEPGVPFSMVTALDLARLPLPSVTGNTVAPLADNEIAINQWVADDQQLAIGDMVRITYFEPETTHGDEVDQTAEFRVADIVAVIEPAGQWRVARGRRSEPVPPDYNQRPTLANDPWMTPTVPGLTDAESIDSWDLPFDTPNIRRQDDDYWSYYRTTPKAFVSLDTGRRLWSSRFGSTTSFRIPADQRDERSIAASLLEQFRTDGRLPGMEIVPIKFNGLRASAGATPFDALFLGLSMFVIGAALALVSLLFRLGLQRRADELGTLLAVGFTQKHAGRLWLQEMLGVCLAGALLGILLGVGYAAVMLWSLRTWLFAGVATPFLYMHINWWTLPLGLVLGLVICVVTINWSLRAARRQSVRSLLAGQIESTSKDKQSWMVRFSRPIVILCLIVAVSLGILAATVLAGDSQAGAFMTSGFLVLLAALVWVYRALRSEGGRNSRGLLSLQRLSRTNASRNPLRSTLTIGLVAVASFLIVAISAFRLSPTDKGTGGFNYVATTSQPVFADLNTPEGQRQVLRGETLDPENVIVPFRYKSGEDASCNNPYQSSQPRVLGVTRLADLRNSALEERNKFSFTMTSAENPWEWLEQPPVDDAIPVIIDKNTAWYSLKIYVPGTVFTVDYDTGESVKFRLVGLLDNSVLQGSLLISEDNFTRLFPDISGYRYFLMDLEKPSEVNKLSDALADQGFDATPTERLLSGFLAVQNTYLSTFQSLGALGLLLGTFGLAAVQLRSVMERRRELGLMRAVGFTRSQLARMILIENAWLLVAGLLIGIGAALVTTLPHYWFGNASVPWGALLGMFVFIAVVGLLTSWLAARSVFQAPLIESLRAA